MKHIWDWVRIEALKNTGKSPCRIKNLRILYHGDSNKETAGEVNMSDNQKKYYKGDKKGKWLKQKPKYISG